MSINKNFIVKNGLEVGTNVIVADESTKKVGVGTTPSSYKLEVFGGLGTKDLTVTGVSTLTTMNVVGVASFVNLRPQGISCIGVVTSAQFSTGYPGLATAIGITTDTISGPSELFIDPAPIGTDLGVLHIKGDLYVDGSYVSLSAGDLDVADKLIGISSNASPDDATTADQSGIKVYGTTDKTFVYNYASDSWLSDQNLDISVGKTYKINGVDVLSSNTLGSGVTISSLQDVGTLRNLNVQGYINAAGGIVGVLTGTSTGLSGTPDILVGLVTASTVYVGSASTLDSSGINVTGVVTASYFYGDATNLFNVPISSRWLINSAGIHTLANVGIGSTLPTSKLTVTGDSRITGVVTAQKFIGDGSGLTGVVGSGSGTIIQDDGVLVGTAGTINFGNNLIVSPISAGLVTVTAESSPWVFTSSGIHTLGNVGVGTTNPAALLDVFGNVSVGNSTTSNASITRKNTDSGLVLSGNGANIELYGSDHASFAGEAYYDALDHNFRNIDSSIVYASISTNTSYFNNTVLIGSATSTGTVDQDLQITGGAYVSGNLGIGTTNPNSKLSVFGSVDISGGTVTFGSTIFQGNSRLGWGVGSFNTTNLTFGINAGAATTNGTSNVAIGHSSLFLSQTGFGNVAIGNSAARGLTRGSGNIAVGHRALSAPFQVDLTGSGNIALGYLAGRDLSLGASGNVIIGSADPSLSSPTGFVLAPPLPTGNEQLVIGSYNGTWIHGNSSYNVGLGVTNPSYKLHVDGTVRGSLFIGDGSGLTGFNATGVGMEVRDDDILVGVATIINFGDNVNVTQISTGIITVTSPRSQWVNTNAGIHTLSSVGIGSTNPQSRLTVYGDARISDGLSVTGVTTITTVGADVATLKIKSDYTDAKIVIERDEIVDKAQIEFYSEELGVNDFTIGLSGDRVFNFLDENGSQLVGIDTTGNLKVAGIVTASGFVGDISGTNFNLSGISTLNTIQTNALKVSGITTTDFLNIAGTNVISSGRQLQNIVSLDATTTATIESAIASAPNDFTNINVSAGATLASLNVTGVSTFTRVGVTTLTTSQLTVSGIVTAPVVSISTVAGSQTGTGTTIVASNGSISYISLPTSGTAHSITVSSATPGQNLKLFVLNPTTAKTVTFFVGPVGAAVSIPNAGVSTFSATTNGGTWAIGAKYMVDMIFLAGPLGVTTATHTFFTLT
jgi:hypothetical protein